ncbi:hypothetical protein [Aquisphaera giovannonii]|uniref:hypothetical protein n=1 Tax=Aquisphaera giovannonii TaxID=406548 RepID=UPI0011E04185|nr:hypothetical protein [Aquisphaera giovannonii]
MATIVIHLQSGRNGIYREYVDAVRTLARLEQLWLEQYPSEADNLIPWPTDLRDPWAVCGALVLEKRFVSDTCPACDRTYGPEEVEILRRRGRRRYKIVRNHSEDRPPSGVEGSATT